MEKRTFDRIPTNLYANLFYNGISHDGIITNISKKGMCINSKLYIPDEFKLKVFIPWREKLIKIHVKIDWLRETDDTYKIGVELLNSPDNYLEIFNIFHFFHSNAQPALAY